MRYKIITDKLLKKLGACKSGRDWFNAQDEKDSIKVIKKLIKEDELSNANWLIVRVMERKQCLKYAIYAAKQVLPIYEKNYPNDGRPREAIKCAKKVLERDTRKNRADADAAYAAADAAAYAAHAAADDAAAHAAADDAAYAAAYTAYAAADDAYAADAAAYTAYAAADDAYAASRKTMKLKVLKYGLKILESEGK